MDWDDAEEFLEIVDSLEQSSFAVVPPMEGLIDVEPIILQSSKAKVKVQTTNSPAGTPTLRQPGGFRELTQRLDKLEETWSLQMAQLHELYSFINSRLDKLEKKTVMS